MDECERGPGQQSPTRALLWFLFRALEQLGTWRARSRARAQLMRLSERELKDMGISRYDAFCEWKKPFWRP